MSLRTLPTVVHQRPASAPRCRFRGPIRSEVTPGPLTIPGICRLPGSQSLPGLPADVRKFWGSDTPGKQRCEPIGPAAIRQSPLQNNLSAGINWYLYSNLRFMVNYVYSHVQGLGVVGGQSHGNHSTLQGRMALDF